MPDRNSSRSRFISDAGWGTADVTPLVQDASFRHYSRITGYGKSALLMDAPPDHEDIRPFIQVSEHLARLGIRCPKLYHFDVDNGFLLLEDLGMDTFTKLLYSGHDELTLYRKALEVLIRLHHHSDATRIALPQYDFDAARHELSLFTHWYLPAVRQHMTSESEGRGYLAAWECAYQDLPKLESTLVLRDFHVDNLMMVEGECAVLDYQDALLGSPAYDLVSLVEDARRDVPEKIQRDIVETYLASRTDIDPADFYSHLAFWGSQRHLKVAGIFTRLWLRDSKPTYLVHLHRVMNLLAASLEHPSMSPVLEWFESENVSLHHPGLDTDREELLATGLFET